MKRSHDEMSILPLPVMSQDDPRKFKSVLNGLYKLRVTKVVDISKPTVKPVDDIDEPENEDEANETKLNKGNARMLRFSLKDSNNTEIHAIETERINELDSVDEDWYIYVHGPVEIRCGNILLEKRNVTGKAKISGDEIALHSPQTHEAAEPHVRTGNVTTGFSKTALADRSTIGGQIVDLNSGMAEDWDDGDDDCIIISDV